MNRNKYSLIILFVIKTYFNTVIAVSVALYICLKILNAKSIKCTNIITNIDEDC